MWLGRIYMVTSTLKGSRFGWIWPANSDYISVELTDEHRDSAIAQVSSKSLEVELKNNFS